MIGAATAGGGCCTVTVSLLVDVSTGFELLSISSFFLFLAACNLARYAERSAVAGALGGITGFATGLTLGLTVGVLIGEFVGAVSTGLLVTTGVG